MADRFLVKRLRSRLERLVGNLNASGKVAAYQRITDRLNELAGRRDNPWSWRYVASFHSATIEPSKKFLRVLYLLLEDINPRQKQWFYFAHYRSVAAVFDKAVKREMIIEQMKRLGYKPVSWKRYAQLKRGAVKRSKRTAR